MKPSDMHRLWKFTPWLTREVSPEKLAEHCRVVDGGALLAKGHSLGEFRQSFPVIELALTLESFDLDCFYWESSIFVSRQLREAMALPASSIEYFEVDSSRSAPMPRSKSYKLMNVPITEDVSDLPRSQYMSRELAPGASVQYNIRRVAIRSEAAPSHALFHDRNFRGYIFCTDELALRVLMAECTGVRFFDPSQLGLGKPMRFRTLRGIEESAWSAAEDRERSILIEALQ